MTEHEGNFYMAEILTVMMHKKHPDLKEPDELTNEEVFGARDQVCEVLEALASLGYRLTRIQPCLLAISRTSKSF